jgi:hypothetical protein
VVGTIGRTLRFIVVMAIPAAARSVFF